MPYLGPVWFDVGVFLLLDGCVKHSTSRSCLQSSISIIFRAAVAEVVVELSSSLQHNIVFGEATAGVMVAPSRSDLHNTSRSPGHTQHNIIFGAASA